MLTPTSHFEIMSRARTPEELAGPETAATASVAGLAEQLQTTFADLAARQEPMPADIAKVLHDNLWSLYVDDEPQAAPVAPLKDHEIREVVNAARDIAKKYHAHECLREVLAKLLVPALQRATPPAASAPTVQPLTEAPIVAEVLAELERATRKFPTWPTDPLHALAVLGEEYGELTKDALQLTYEPHKTNAANVRTEAIQTAAMALRWAMSLDHYEYTPGVQHAQAGITAAPTKETP